MDLSPDAFDLEDPEIRAEPYPYYSLMREQKPVMKSSFQGQPCWIVSRRKDVSAILMDPKTYSSRTTPEPKSMLHLDPPDHDRMRMMLSSGFTRPAVQPMAEGIETAAERIFGACMASGTCDAVVDFASPVGINTMAQMLGLSVAQTENVRDWTGRLAEYVLATRIGRTPPAHAKAASDEIAAFFMDIAAREDYAPNSVLATLTQGFRDGKLNQKNFVGQCVLMFTAGHATTTNLIGNAIYVLAQRPEELDRLRADEANVAPFVEEVLRTRPSFHRIQRITTRDVELHGEFIPAGSIVRLLLASANRDAEAYPDGEAFDAARSGRTTLAFGQGVHSCLGSWLARLEANIAMRVVARHATAISLDSDRRPTPLTGGTFNEFGFDHLPVVLHA